MKTFLINLDKNSDRLVFMDKQLKALGIEYERVSGVYGVALTSDELKKNFSPFRSFCVEGRRLRKGEIGCALSHCKIYSHMSDANIEMALILEDDADITNDVKGVLLQIGRFIDTKKKQVFILSSHSVDKTKEYGIEPIENAMMTDGYVITLPAAKAILKGNKPVKAVADRWRRFKLYYGVELYRAWPTIVSQAPFATDVNTGSIIISNRCAKFLHKVVHAVGLVLDWITYKATGV